MLYFVENQISALKLEDPGLDHLGFQVLDAFPEARWMTSVRSLDAILTSHHNVLKWGHDEDYVLHAYKSTLALLELVHERHRLLAVSIDEPDRFQPVVFARFLGVEPNRALEQVASEWSPINDLRYQKEKWGETYDGRREVPPGLSTLRARHDWIEEAEERYDKLVKDSWAYHSQVGC